MIDTLLIFLSFALSVALGVFFGGLGVFLYIKEHSSLKQALKEIERLYNDKDKPRIL